MANRQATASSNTSNSSQGISHRFMSFRNRFGRRPDGDRSQLTNPSAPTRRPRGLNEPPPPYREEASPSAPDPAAELDAAPGTFTISVPAPDPAPAAAEGQGPSSPSVGFRIRQASPAPSNRSTSSRLTAGDVQTPEDPYAFLTIFDTVFVIDDSGSMAGGPWREVQSVLSAITPICTQRDIDGVDLYFLNHRCTLPEQEQLLGRIIQAGQPRVPPGKAAGGFHNVRDAASVSRIFGAVKPSQSTPTGMRLRTIFQPYLRFYEAKRNEMKARGEYGDPDPEEVKPMNIIVITDGVPTDDLGDVLIQAAKKLDAMDAPPYQVGVQFFQVGTEPEAAEYLRHLDDTLGENEPTPIRDMVDTATWDVLVQQRPNGSRAGDGASSSASVPRALGLTVEGILKVVLGAVVKRLDNETASTRGGGGAAQRRSTNTLHP